MFTHEMVRSFNQLEMDVYNYILQNEDKVIYMKVRELADAVHVSTTTVLRFCKKAGCEGYSEFRLKLKQELKGSKETELDMDVMAMSDFFQRVRTKAFRENMEEALDYLIRSASVIFVGVGNSSIMGKYGARYFNNVGLLSFAIDDPFTPVFRGKNEKTTVIALSVSGVTKETILLAERLKRRGCCLISVTNRADCTLAKMSDCNINYYIPCYNKDDYDLTSQMAVVFIIEFLGRKLKGIHNSAEDLMVCDEQGQPEEDCLPE
ncbi:MAG: MurR/RpiR family transcriptional regulator [Eubacterium sp.]|nr:MurR/RpiR family transcriptional regulator [Eubacterium sp.]